MILIVDDDKPTRQLIALVLDEHGYDSLPVRNAEEALQVFSERTSEIQLVIMDIVMPGMSGIEASEEMSRIGPGVPVLLMSGHLYDLDQPFIQKPFRSSQIMGSVRTLALP